MIRWGLIGCGDVARKRVAAAIQNEPRSQLVAACRRDPERLAEFCDHFAIAGAFHGCRATHQEPGSRCGVYCHAGQGPSPANTDGGAGGQACAGRKTDGHDRQRMRPDDCCVSRGGREAGCGLLPPILPVGSPHGRTSQPGHDWNAAGRVRGDVHSAGHATGRRGILAGDPGRGRRGSLDGCGEPPDQPFSASFWGSGGSQSPLRNRGRSVPSRRYRSVIAQVSKRSGGNAAMPLRPTCRSR